MTTDAITRMDAFRSRDLTHAQDAATAAIVQAPRARTATFWVVVAPMLVSVFLAKVAIPVGAGIGLPLVLLPAIAAAGLLMGKLVFHAGRLAALAATTAVLIGFQVFFIGEYSLSSLLMMTVLFSTYAVTARGQQDISGQVWRYFLDFSLAIAWVGIAQFVLQFVLPRDVVFPIEFLLKKIGLLIEGFNYLIPLRYASATLKSNGVFFLEPSFFSQFLALAIVMELVTLSRPRRLMVYAVSYAMTYSGTGLMMLMVCLPFYVVSRRRWGLVVAGTVAVLMLLPFSQELHLNIFLERAAEFGQPGTSGFERFVGGFYMFDQFLLHDPMRALFGFGAGAFKLWVTKTTLPATELAFFKIVFEFGLVGALVFFAFVIYAVATSHAPLLVRTAIGVSFLLNGMYVPSSHGMALTLLLWPACAACRGIAGVTRPRRHEPAAVRRCSSQQWAVAAACRRLRSECLP